MRVKVEPGTQINHNGKVFEQGQTVTVENEVEARRYIAAGWAVEVGKRSDG